MKTLQDIKGKYYNWTIRVVIDGHLKMRGDIYDYMTAREKDEITNDMFEKIKEYDSFIQIFIGDHEIIHYDLQKAIDIAYEAAAYPVADRIRKPLISCE